MCRSSAQENVRAGRCAAIRGIWKNPRKQDIFIQICNHNYLLADAYHRAEGYKPLLADYRTVIVDEAHKLPEAAKQMFGKNLCMDDIREVAYYLEREHQTEEVRILQMSCMMHCMLLVQNRRVEKESGKHSVIQQIV